MSNDLELHTCLQQWSPLIAEIHSAPDTVAIVTSGAGSLLASFLQMVPGASATLIESRSPYAAGAIDRYLGRSPERYCDPGTARRLAAMARHEASACPGRSDKPVWGLSCTGSLASLASKRGTHRFHWVAHSNSGTSSVSVELTKGSRSRSAEEVVCTRTGLLLLAKCCGVLDGDSHFGDLLFSTDRIETDQQSASLELVKLLDGDVPLLCRVPGSAPSPSIPAGPSAVLSGSFDPLHDGHRKLRQAAADVLRTPVLYEIPLVNADKPPLDFLSLRDRFDQFDAPVLLSRAATFVEKSRVMPDTVFVIGWDTCARLLDPRFYSSRGCTVEQAFNEIRDNGCRFLVAGRFDDDQFRELHELPIPIGAAKLFQALPNFRLDVSSTQLRSDQSSY